MALEVTVKHPDFPDGHEFVINGLGTFPNGKTVTVSEEQEQSFVSQRFTSVREAFAGSSTVQVKGTSTVQGKDIPEPPVTTEGSEG